jgi:hypothetical protein
MKIIVDPVVSMEGGARATSSIPPFVRHLLSARQCLSCQDRPALPSHFLGAASLQYFLIKRGGMIAFFFAIRGNDIEHELSALF